MACQHMHYIFDWILQMIHTYGLGTKLNFNTLKHYLCIQIFAKERAIWDFKKILHSRKRRVEGGRQEIDFKWQVKGSDHVKVAKSHKTEIYDTFGNPHLHVTGIPELYRHI